ncbi:unnamed protein product [Cuscuta campestris]|uniref:Uncharacterized protein n=1 Tax=Cuscuta campestris TaxID=132261 RepID=A0A484L1P9_9ASTE|nr:unnamed protein product [Cuscuta campestris]
MVSRGLLLLFFLLVYSLESPLGLLWLAENAMAEEESGVYYAQQKGETKGKELGRHLSTEEFTPFIHCDG